MAQAADTARIFISYRRDDAAGYAGRLEEALERRLGHGAAFRDVQDIAPGADFVEVIRRRLAEAHTMVVLIGPRWAGGERAGPRRIDDPGDLVRLEVQVALDAGLRVLPVLLPGATMPAEADLPLPLRPLARRNALPLTDTHWDADVERLVASLGLRTRRAAWPWAAGGALVAAVAVAAWCQLRPPPPAPVARVVGLWQADVRYEWGARHTERFEIVRHAGTLTGTATFLGYPRAIEKVQFDGTNLRFETRSEESMGSETRQKTHAYAAELRGQPPAEALAFRMHTTGGFRSTRPLEFEARRIPGAAPGGGSAAGPR